LASFWLVFVSCLPAAIPFLIFSEPQVALRVSNFLLIIGLFYVGQKWADYAGKNRVVFGLALVAVGLMLVGVAILLGCYIYAPACGFGDYCRLSCLPVARCNGNQCSVGRRYRKKRNKMGALVVHFYLPRPACTRLCKSKLHGRP